MLKTASGADALELATARVEGAQAKLAVATAEQADAEKHLLEVRSKEGATADEIAAATDKLAASDKAAAKAASAFADAEKRQADTAAAAAKAAEDAATKTDETAAKTDAATKKTDESSNSLSKVGKGAGILAIGLGLVGGAMVKSAADFQSSTEHLVTDAGESQQNLGMVQQGILNIASATGTSAEQLVGAMYHIESAGNHGAAGLQILQTAAEGAKVGGADFDTVAKTLTGTMNSFSNSNGPIYTSTQMMNMLITTVGQGDMKMQDLASSLGNVAPIAASAGLSFSQVGGALATMTSQNMSADQASQDLANTIRSLQNAQGPAIKEMQALGLSSNDVSENLGKRGLTGTLDMLTEAVAKHTEGGQVLIDTFRSSTQASSDANAMIAKMPENLQKLADAYLNGSVTTKQWRTDLQNMDPVSAHLMGQFATLADKTHSFNDLLSSGKPAAQSYNAAMSALLGGATGLNTALMLTGGRMDAFNKNAAAIQAAADKGGASVDNWSKIQGTMNQKIDVLKSSLGAAAIAIGTALLPAVTSLIQSITQIVTPIAEWIDKHQGLAAAILAGAAALAALMAAIALTAKVVESFKLLFAGVSTVLGVFKRSTEEAATSTEALGAASAAAATETEGAQIATGGWASKLGSAVPIIGSVIAGAAMLGTKLATMVQGADFAAYSVDRLNTSMLGISKEGPAAQQDMVRLGEGLATASQLMNHSTDALKSYDQSLANLVSSGHADDAKTIIDQLAAATDEHGKKLINVAGDFPAYQAALDKAANSAKLNSMATDSSSSSLDANATAVGIDTSALKGLNQQAGTTNTTLSGFQKSMSQTQYLDQFHSNLLQITQSVKDNGRALDGNSQSGLANRQAISQAASGIENFYQQQVDAKVPIKDFGSALSDQITQLETTATQATGSKDAVKGYLDELGLLKLQKEITTQVKVDVDTSQLTDAQKLVQSIGGTVHLRAFADGGWVPGSPGAAQLIVAHAGEYVLSRDMLSGRVTPDLSMMASFAPTGAGGGFALAPQAPAGGAATQINVIVQGNHVLGDQAATQLANKIGRQLATQILPAAGVRIRS